MTRRFVTALSFAAIAAAFGIGSEAHAGLRSPVPVAAVRYSNGQVYAAGNMSTARYSADAIQWIGCSTYTFATGTQYISCGAKNASGFYVGCSINTTQTGYWNFRDAFLAVGDYSYISFSSDTQGRCSNISVQDYSYQLP
jgi:hypothetical protein